MLERLLLKKVEVWVVGLLATAAVLGLVAISVVVRVTTEGDERFGRLGETAVEISRLPENLRRAIRLVTEGAKADLAVSEPRFEGQAGFTFAVPPGTDPSAGYLVLSRYDGDRSRSVVELVDLGAQRMVHRWEPDFSAVNARSGLRSRLTNLARDNAPARARAMHPLLTLQGDLIFQNMSPLVKLGPCGDLLWIVDRLFHHSIEAHPEGGYLASTFLEPQTVPGVSSRFKEDAIVHVADDGRVLYEKSVARLLIENGLSHLIYGLDFYSDDPLHLNDVQYVPVDGPYFRKGDLFLSLRNVSAIVLYRPATNKVIWLKQGPWVNQHDVDVLDDHRIAVFNNNRFNQVDRSLVHGANDVVVYDFARDAASSPYRDDLERLEVRTISEGRSEILADGDLVVEESDYGRVLRLRRDGGVAWSYVNRASDGRVYLLNWTRYVDADAGLSLMKHLAPHTDCGRHAAGR